MPADSSSTTIHEMKIIYSCFYEISKTFRLNEVRLEEGIRDIPKDMTLYYRYANNARDCTVTGHQYVIDGSYVKKKTVPGLYILEVEKVVRT
jgi:hypothetical protein